MTRGWMNNYAVYLCQNARTDEGVKRFMAAAPQPAVPAPPRPPTPTPACACMPPSAMMRRRPTFVRALQQTTQLRRGRLPAGEPAVPARPAAGELVPASTASWASTRRRPTCCCSECSVARAQGDRLAAQKYARRLQMDFPTPTRRVPWPASTTTRADAVTNAAAGGAGVRGIGARLRSAREQRALTVLQAAEKLHVDPRVLDALESEDFGCPRCGRVRARSSAPLRRAGR